MEFNNSILLSNLDNVLSLAFENVKVFWNFVRYKPEHAEGGLDGHGLRHLVDLEHVAQVDREVHPGQKINKISITFWELFYSL